MQWLPEECEKKFVKGEQDLRLKTGINNGITRNQFIENTWMKRERAKMVSLEVHRSHRQWSLGLLHECRYHTDQRPDRDVRVLNKCQHNP